VRFDKLYFVSGNRKERRAQIAAMGKKGRKFREDAFKHNALKAQSDKETL
jgi:hypothetical protein